MPKSEDLSRSLEINAIWTFDTEFPTIFNKSCTYITFKSAVKHRQLNSLISIQIKESTLSHRFSITYYMINCGLHALVRGCGYGDHGLRALVWGCVYDDHSLRALVRAVGMAITVSVH